MKIRRVERKQLIKNPLQEVIVQIQFTRNMEIEEGLPAKFQKLVVETFPIFEAQETYYIDFKIGAKGEQGSAKQEKAPSVYHFKSEDNKRRISLSSEFVALSSNQYGDWKSFKETIATVFETLRSVYTVPIINRIGLRYRNLICRSELDLGETSWTELLKPNVIGHTNTPGMFEEEGFKEQNVTATKSISQIKLSECFLLIQSGFVEKMPEKEKCFFIDNDFFNQSRMKTKDFQINKELERLHGDAESVFRHLVTDRLYQAFQPE